MIATLTVNPCIDKTVTVEEFDLYRMNRVQVLRTDPSGKGINVSKAIHALGGHTLCAGFDFTDGMPSPLVADMEREGIAYDFVPVTGHLRVCTKIFDRSRQHTIEVNEGGAPVTEADGEAMLDCVARVAAKSDYITLSGSLPAGLPSDFYRRCMRRIRRDAPDCRLVVDAERNTLLEALEEGPYLIKPNIHEFEATFGCKIDGIESLDREVKKIFAAYGLSIICVSLGGDGAYIADRKEAYFCQPAKVTVRSLQGAGDSMVAGICMALEQGRCLPDVLRYGVAAAGASVMQEGTQVGTKADFESLLKQDFSLQKIR